MKKGTVWTIIIIVVLVGAGIYLLNLPAEKAPEGTTGEEVPIVPGEETVPSAEKIKCPAGAKLECTRPDGKMGYQVCENSYWSEECHWLPDCSVDETTECVGRKDRKGFRTCQNDRWSEECYLANIDDCKLKSKDDPYELCLLDQEKPKLVYSDRKNIKSGELVVIDVNLEKAIEEANLELDPYQVCAFDNLEKSESIYFPDWHKFYTNFREKGIHCFVPRQLKDIRSIRNYGLVPDSDKISLTVRAWPENVDLSTPAKAKENINQSIIIFTYEK